jgi:hypothetical protein
MERRVPAGVRMPLARSSSVRGDPVVVGDRSRMN